MLNSTVRGMILGALLVSVSGIVAAQVANPTWLPCSRCLSLEQEAEATAKAKTLPFTPRDLSGVWGLGTNGFNLNQAAVPPMTPWGQAKYDAAKPGLGRRGVPLGNDPMMICDPLGHVRSYTYNYGMEFVQTPSRIFQFFEYDHVWRTIYMDGRKLPTDTDPRWYGYAVGRWDGDTLVVESAGYDERTWLDQDGHPHSDQMHVTERYRRVDAGTLQVEVTVQDPKTYTRPWVTNSTIRLNPLAELGEQFCSPSEEEAYRLQMREPAAREAR